jgi:hypothetical protein
MQEMQVRNQNPPLLDPPPKERVLQLLEKLEAGDLSAWWQLNMEMTLKAESKYYDNEFELDLTKLPGWQEAEEATRRRIIEGAKNYIQQQNDISYKWIGTNTFERSAIAGCRAFQLVLKESSDFLNTLSPEIWRKWASVIIAVPSSNQHEDSYLEIVKRSYLNAPEECINTLITLIDKNNHEYDCIFVIDRFEKCWDERLKLALLEKAKDPSLKPKCVGQLLEEFLKQGLIEARDFAKSLIYLPLPLAENEREKALIASRVMIENLDPPSWSYIWSLFQQDSSFGREVLELVAYRYSHGIYLNLTETQLADLYYWLVLQYPHNEDSDYSNEVIAHSVNSRDSVAKLRDSVLIQLKEGGTLQACDEIQRLIRKLPNITWLKKTLLDAQASMRRQTWKSPKPEDILQLTAIQEPLNSELLTNINETNKRMKQMTDQPTIAISGGTFNGPVNLASNHGNQPTTIIGNQNNYFGTDESLRQEIADLNEFIAELETKHPNLLNEAEADKILDTEIVAVKTTNPTRWQNLRHQMSLLKRQLLNPERHLQATKATLVEVTKSAYEKSLIVKAIITYIDKLSEEPNHGA